MKDNAGLEINELNDISKDTNQENSTSSPPYQLIMRKIPKNAWVYQIPFPPIAP